MSLLSKIFIVLLVVLSIAVAVSVLIIQRDVLAPKEQLAQLQQTVEELKLSNLDQKTQAVRERSELTAQLRTSEADRSRAQAESNAVRKERDKFADDSDKAAKKVDLANSERDYWSGVAQRREAELANAQKALNDTRVAYESANKNYNQMNTKFTEVSTQHNFLLQQVKLLREQIVILQDRINNASANASAPAAAGSGSDTTRHVAATGGPTIKGQIKAVADNQTMATINVGANDGVAEGMEFTVFRKGKFIAKLVVTRVDAKTSVGRLDMVQQERVQIDDKAWNQLSAN